jgi:hypothetical protein
MSGQRDPWPEDARHLRRTWTRVTSDGRCRIEARLYRLGGKDVWRVVTSPFTSADIDSLMRAEASLGGGADFNAQAFAKWAGVKHAAITEANRALWRAEAHLMVRSLAATIGAKPPGTAKPPASLKRDRYLVQAVHEFVAEWSRTHGKQRGTVKAAAAHFKMSAKQISRLLKAR